MFNNILIFSKKKKRLLFLALIIIFVFTIGLVFSISSKNSNSELVDINTHRLEDNIKEKKNILVYIGRPTCEDCAEFYPVLEESLKDSKQKVYYYNTDIAKLDNEKDLMNMLSKLNVTSVPTMVSLKDGEIKKKIVGYQNKSQIKNFLEN